VYAVLVALTLATIGISRFLHLPLSSSAHTLVGLGIAVTKATLVVLIFMHVLYSHKMTWLVILTSLLFLVILLALTMCDYWVRPLLGYPGAG
jgi:caa(3)-type oxidase subunit IV